MGDVEKSTMDRLRPRGHRWFLRSRTTAAIGIAGVALLGFPGRLGSPAHLAAAPVPPQGYWMIASDVGVFPFGTAVGYGSTGGTHLNQPIVGITRVPAGTGYWLVASDGSNKRRCSRIAYRSVIPAT
jgi:hypothetical protein